MNFPFIDILNSLRRDPKCGDTLCDKLDDPEWIRSFLGRWGLGTAGPARPEALRELRDAMARILGDITNDREPAKADMEKLGSALNASAMRHELVPEAGGYRLKAVPVRKDWDWALHSIALPFAELLTSEDKKRLKRCSNAGCGWVFYDETKNNTRRWCCSTCGNLIKVRECRKRKKECEAEESLNEDE